MRHIIELINKKIIADRTMEFHFTKPEGFTFKAGQFCDFTLIDPAETDAGGNIRTFSLISAPQDNDLAIAARIRNSSFKRTLKNAYSGLCVEMDGPIGSFTLHENIARAGIFLIGGIGITPIISMLRDATNRELPHKLYLFYSNRKPEDALFLDELTSLAAKNKNFTFVPIMTQSERSYEKWNRETGRITQALIEKYAPARANAFYYMAGPQMMVMAMRELLNDIGVSDDDIRTDEFSGY